MIQIYRGDSLTLSLQFADDGGVPLNVSGYLVRGVAKSTYTQALSDAIINKVVTGVAPQAITGLIYFPITTGESTQCAGDYLLDFQLQDMSSGRSTYPTDGLRILPTTYP